jgi:hypothetical protein
VLRITTQAAKSERTTDVARLLAACGVACALAWASGARASSSVHVLAASGPDVAGELTPAPGDLFANFEHASASPGGALVVVGRLIHTTTVGGDQAIWVRPANGPWRMVLQAGNVEIKDTSGATVSSLLAGPVVNDAGQVLVPANVVLTSDPIDATPTPALLCIDADGTTRLLLRFNTDSSAGEVGMPVGMPAGRFLGFDESLPGAYRFTNAGAYYASDLGLLTNCGVGSGVAASGAMSFLTCVASAFSDPTGSDAGGKVQGSVGRGGHGNPGNATGAGQVPVGIGNAVLVGVARKAIGLSAAGSGFQHVSMSGYTPNQLAGVLMFDSMRLPSFAVRDGTTPIADMPGQFVLSTVPGSDAKLSAGVNSAGTLIFTGRYGPPPVNTGFPNTSGDDPPATNPLAMFIKERWAPARLVAHADPSAQSPLALAPGFPGFRFASFTSPVVNARGAAAFGATLVGPGVARNSIWAVDPSGPPHPIAVVDVLNGVVEDAGSPAGEFGARYTILRSEPMLNARGQISFFAQISEPLPSGGVRTFEALCGYDPVLGPSILARSGDVVTVPGVGGRPLTITMPTEIGSSLMNSSGNDDGAATALTDDGLVIFRAAVSGHGQIVATTRIETPIGACCAGSTCGVQARLDCIGPAHRFVGVATTCTSGSTASCCPADFDQSGIVGVQDLLGFIQAWTTGSTLTDVSGDGQVAIPDLLAYLQSYLGGCD